MCILPWEEYYTNLSLHFPFLFSQVVQEFWSSRQNATYSLGTQISIAMLCNVFIMLISACVFCCPRPFPLFLVPHAHFIRISFESSELLVVRPLWKRSNPERKIWAMVWDQYSSLVLTLRRTFVAHSLVGEHLIPFRPYRSPSNPSFWGRSFCHITPLLMYISFLNPRCTYGPCCTLSIDFGWN